MDDDLRKRYAEALAEKFTWPAFKFQMGRYPEVAEPEPTDLTGKHMRAFFVDEGGHPGFRPLTCDEAAEVCAAVRDTELERLREAAARVREIADDWATLPPGTYARAGKRILAALDTPQGDA